MFPSTGSTPDGLLDSNIVNIMVRDTTNLVVQRNYLLEDHGHNHGGTGQAKAQPSQGIINTFKPDNLIQPQVLRDMNLQISRFKVHDIQLTFELSPLAHFISTNGYFIVPVWDLMNGFSSW